MLCCAIHYVVSDTYLTTSHLACYINYSGMIDWPLCNESLVRRGQVLLDFDVLDGWDLKLSQINEQWLRLVNPMTTQIHLLFSF
jgi:hypothetical protein